MKRPLRALFAPSFAPSARRRTKLSFDGLEDRTVPTAAGIIGGNVFLDANSDSIKNGIDVAMPGIAVTLTGTTDLGNAVNVNTTSDGAGNFQFQKLEPGTYQVSAANPDFNPAVGGLGNLGGAVSGNAVQDVVLQMGQVETNLHFGLTGLKPTAQNVSLRLFLNTSVGNTNQIFGSAFKAAGTGKAFADGLLIAPQSLTGTNTLDGDVKDDGGNALANFQVVLTVVSHTGISVVSSATTDSAGHYSFTQVVAGDWFVDVIPQAGFRAGGATVGNLGGAAPRADQLAPTFVQDGVTAKATGYNFTLNRLSVPFDAGLANDEAGGSLGTFSDGITSDGSIRGVVANPSTLTALDARFTAGGSTGFVSVKNTVGPDGSFLLSEQTLRDVFGGGLVDGSYTVEIRATRSDGTTQSKSVSFTLKTQGPEFLRSYQNISKAAASVNDTFLLAGGFTDPNITDSSVTFKVLKGTTPVDINVELFDKDAPGTVANFFNYFTRYDDNGGVLFHRLHLEDGLKVLQGGGFTFNTSNNTINTHLTQDPQIRNEFSQDRPNDRGTIAMAKTSDPDSATSEFFFNLDDVNADTLNVNNPKPNGGSAGFTVFGKVTSDADLAVLDDLATTPTENQQGQAELPVLGGGAVTADNLLRVQQVVTNHRDDELTYSVTSSNTSVVTATVGGFQGNQLTLDYLAAGTSTITVAATDKAGNTATQTFIVTVTA